MRQKILQGTWGKRSDTVWEFFISEKLPKNIPVSAVMGVPFWNGKIALTKTKRGWEIPGGHINEGEDILSCLKRELREEVGADKVSSSKLFGFRKIKNPPRKKKYPKWTVVPYYIVNLSAKPTGANAIDCFDSKLVKITHPIIKSSHDSELIALAHSIWLAIEEKTELLDNQ